LARDRDLAYDGADVSVRVQLPILGDAPVRGVGGGEAVRSRGCSFRALGQMPRYNGDTMLTTDDVIDRMLNPVAAALTGDAARRFIDVRFDAEVQAHLAHLAELASEGQLSADQRVDYEFFLTVSDVISLLKVKVRDAVPAASAVPVA